MARRRRNFTFDGRSHTRYPWKRWTDGEAWEVIHGKDFACELDSFLVYLYHKAKKLGMTVNTKTLRDEGKPVRVVFKFNQPAKVKRQKRPR